MAQMTFSCNLALPCEVVVSGTKGSIRLHSPFWCTTKLDTLKASKITPILPPCLSSRIYLMETKFQQFYL